MDLVSLVTRDHHPQRFFIVRVGGSPSLKVLHPRRFSILIAGGSPSMKDLYPWRTSVLNKARTHNLLHTPTFSTPFSTGTTRALPKLVPLDVGTFGMLGTAPRAEQVPPFWPQLCYRDLKLFKNPTENTWSGCLASNQVFPGDTGNNFLGTS